MKTYISRSKRQQGNTWLTTIMITGLIGFILAVYLTLVQSQNTATFRSQAWNMAMPVVEAGIEDGLAHINANFEVGLDRDGWTQSGNIYTITRSVGESFYMARITNFVAGSYSNCSPVINSYGYVMLPGAMAPANSSVMAAAGLDSTTIAYLGRGVRVQAIPDFIFGRGMVAKESIDLNGNWIRTDSFDSTDPRFSTNGLYWAPWARDHGDIAVNSSLTNSLNIGNAEIFGTVSTGPGGTIAIGPNGSVGDTAWNSSHDGIQTGHSKSDMNVSFKDAKVPFSGGMTPSGGWLTNIMSTSATNATTVTSIPFPTGILGPITTNYPVNNALYPLGSPGPITTNWNNKHTLIDHYTYPTFSYGMTNVATTFTTNRTYYDCLIREGEGGDYRTDTLVGGVYIGANARMYVTTTLNISDLIIKPGVSFRLYTSAASASLAGNNSVNSDGTADAFSFWGLPATTNISFSGNAGFKGTIYAPNADFVLNGTGNSTTIDFSGASITKSARLNGHFNFHYDEALRRIGPFSGYIIDQWVEMTPADVPRFTVTSSGGGTDIQSTGGTISTH